MDITRASLNNPAAVAAVLALVVLFGVLAMFDLPLQLFPDIDRPQMSVVTNWRAASPTEIESEILEPQEEVLQGMPGMEEMEGNAFAGGSFVNLTFEVGTDMQAVLVDVLGRLNRLPPMPADADPPVVQLSAEDTNQNLTTEVDKLKLEVKTLRTALHTETRMREQLYRFIGGHRH